MTSLATMSALWPQELTYCAMPESIHGVLIWIGIWIPVQIKNSGRI